MSDDPDAIKADLAKLIAEARTQGVYLWCYYQDLWFSPEELEAANANGKFLWGPVNWKLRHPREHQAMLDETAKGATNAASAWRTKWQGP